MSGKISPIQQGITVALPAYNEEASIEGMVKGSLEALEAATDGGREVLIVNDGSTDQTGRIARDLQDRFQGVRVHEHERNRGFAAVQKSCIEHASQDWIFLIPSDGQIDPATLLDFISHCADSDLILGIAARGTEHGLRGFNSHMYHRVVRALFGLKRGDFGPCLMVRRELAQSLRIHAKTPVFMTELVVKAKASGAGMAQVKVDKKQREYGRARGGRMLNMAPRIAAELAGLYLDVTFKKRKNVSR